MKNILILLLFLSCYKFNAFGQGKSDLVLGEWITEKKDSRVLIFKQNDRFFGKITWGSGKQTKDEKNPDASLRNRDLLGLVILNNFKYDDKGVFIDGTIYDPREGKTYSCKMTLRSDKQLSVRGYIGLSLFGKSEVWTKIN